MPKATWPRSATKPTGGSGWPPAATSSAQARAGLTVAAVGTTVRCSHRPCVRNRRAASRSRSSTVCITAPHAALPNPVPDLYATCAGGGTRGYPSGAGRWFGRPAAALRVFRGSLRVALPRPPQHRLFRGPHLVGSADAQRVRRVVQEVRVLAADLQQRVGEGVERLLALRLRSEEHTSE